MKPITLVSGAAGLLLVTGCAGGSSSNADADLTVAASFYPLQYVAEAVGGDNVDVIPLAAPGVEPHDLELSPSAVRELSSADLVLYLSEFQPAVDDALVSTQSRAFDAADAVELRPAEEHDHEHEDGEEDHDHGQLDPHFWLDPTLLAEYATAVGQQFAQLDPDNSATYIQNATDLRAELTALDETFTSGLEQCERRDIVTSHEAFAYLADRYNLEQVGIAGIDPETEPSPAKLLEIRDLVEETGTTTIFTESLVNTSVADAIAKDTGATTAVLDPIESVVDDDDYATVMARNLDSLRQALACA
ncbi:metal ABC transporter substrate-binding protein [Demequina sp.]|uniref:metal ABC transporter substrate-binding protein n=1 Tax=Demequina sp. TaxID=2050685 RepID=UPI003D0B3D94